MQPALPLLSCIARRAEPSALRMLPGSVHLAMHAEQHLHARAPRCMRACAHTQWAPPHLVRVRIVELDGRKHRVVKAAVERGQRKHDGVALVRLERAGDGQVGGRVSVEHVYELLLLQRADDARAALGVGGDVLPGHDAAAAAAAKRLLVHFDKRVALPVELEDDDAARVGADEYVVARRARQAERGEAADAAKHVSARDNLQPPVVAGAHELQQVATRNDDLLRLGRGEVAVDGALSGGEQRQQGSKVSAAAAGGARRRQQPAAGSCLLAGCLLADSMHGPAGALTWMPDGRLSVRWYRNMAPGVAAAAAHAIQPRRAPAASARRPTALLALRSMR